MIKSVHAVIIIAVLTLLPPVMPAANGESPIVVRTGLLAKLPSAPGAHVARIQALADGGWLNLGAPAPDSKWGTPPGRSYTCKMAAAPDLGGGFLYGEGPHGATGQRGGQELYNDDLFFYDLNAHAWVCCYPGTPVRDPDIKFDPKRKCEVNSEGQPVPVAPLIHGYADTAYSVKRKVFAFLPNGSYFWDKEKTLGPHRDWANVKVTDKLGPWTYNAATGKWEFHTAAGTPPPTYGGLLEFVMKDGKEQLFRYRRSGEIWFYNLDDRKWTQMHPKGPAPPWGIEANMCYDTRRQRIYMGGGEYPVPKDANVLWAYDIKTNTLIDLKAKNSVLKRYATWGAVMTYDSANDKVVLMKYKGDEKDPSDPVGTFIYDPESNTWSDPVPLPKDIAADNRQANGFYSATHNVHVYHMASDGRTNNRVWVYRWKK